MRRHSGSGNAWMPLLLENGLKASRIGLTAQESQYLEARQFQLADIARIFRISPCTVGNFTGQVLHLRECLKVFPVIREVHTVPVVPGESSNQSTVTYWHRPSCRITS